MFNTNRGTHWREYYTRNRELYNLAWRNAAECADPWVEDVEEESDGTLNLIYGSRGATITLELVDSEAVGLFGYGYCTLLALAIHRKTGFPLALFTTKYENGSWSGHATVQLPDGSHLDIQGVRSTEDIQREYNFTVNPTIHTIEQFCNIIASGEHAENPMSFVDRLEQLVTEDFADLLIRKWVNKTQLFNHKTEYVIPLNNELVNV